MFESGTPPQRLVADLLRNPDRLLTAVLFWNLLINVAYFAISSIISLRLERDGRAAEAGVSAFVSLLVIICIGELVPKSLAVTQPQLLATTVSVPLAAAVRLVSPLLPVLSLVNLLSRRLLWPRFEPEPYLEIQDLERAVRQSTTDAALLQQEHIVLQHILSLSQIRVDELMRPRTQFLTFRPPVALQDLDGQVTPTGYLLITEPNSEEVAAALPLTSMPELPQHHLERYAEDVVYVPWCTNVADALDEMRRHQRRVAAVVNEYGETIGILTLDDVMDTIFTETPSRTSRFLHRKPIREVAPGVWHVNGITTLRRLAHFFQVELPPTKSITVAGVVQELLERLPQVDDRCQWGPFDLTVLEVTQRGQMTVEMRRLPDGEENGAS